MTTMKLSAYKAHGAPDKVVIEIIHTLPEMKALVDPRDFFKMEAERIAGALFASLPGGTIDALLVELMKSKLSLLVVPHERKEP